MPARAKKRQDALHGAAPDTTVAPPTCTSGANDSTTVPTKSGITAVTRNSNELAEIVPNTALQGYEQSATKSPPPRGATAHMSSLGRCPRIC